MERAIMSSDIKVLLVEDQFLVAKDIHSRLKKMGYVPVATATNAADAFRFFDEHSPDLVLMDIEIDGDKNGIETAKEIREIKNVPIVFLTQLDQMDTYREAREASPYAYLTKPVTDLQLMQAIDLAIEKHQNHSSSSNPPTFNNCLFVKQKEIYRRVNLEKIVRIEAAGPYCQIITLNSEHAYTLSKSMGEILRTLDRINSNHRLIQIHRSHAVNLDFVEALDGTRVLVNGEKIDIGKTYFADFKAKMQLI